jgi:hypothetical protein
MLLGAFRGGNPLGRLVGKSLLDAARRFVSGSPLTPRRYGSIPIRSLTAPLIRCLQPR